MAQIVDLLDLADRLVQRIRRLGHPLCVGLDPHLERIFRGLDLLEEATQGPPQEAAAAPSRQIDLSFSALARQVLIPVLDHLQEDQGAA